MREKYECKLVGKIGPGTTDNRSMTRLNRIIEWREDGLHLGSDQRHAEAVSKELGLMGAKGGRTPGVKEKEENFGEC